ncbi:MAG: phage holin family protein, partial [Eubacteriales bacterium]|nr:phage holin family protein [Eubacteriales bacterium]
LSRKMMMLALVVLATALDTLLTLDGVSRAAVIGFYCANEGLSIVENAALLGVPFPQALLDTLEKMQKK